VDNRHRLGQTNRQRFSYGAKELHIRWQLRELMIAAQARFPGTDN